MEDITKTVMYEIVGQRNIIKLNIIDREFVLSDTTFHIIDLIALMRLIAYVSLDEGYLNEIERALLTKFLEEMEEM